ncbi:zinc transporter ZIP9-A-like isoform X2 [Hemiscyllium ocellatum]|uniref:zinc transporter ZIP9-A-like isoform X2 n=1 Tax=Hemiscyllium ocellatum TaxID=170820 RepID=UPI0029666D44|nr:zinc transporter ZIP9-A-like isoform X2 [Hemiscyllium ocellatum]
MDGAITIILLSLAMFGGCLLLGMIPLTIRLPQEKLKFVTVLGAGLLCGTALAIIIPEGIELLLGDLTTDQQRNISQKQVIMEYKVSDGKQAGTKEFAPPHFVIGISLVMGFLLMFIIDQIGNCITWQGETSSGPAAGSSLTATLGLVIHAAADGVALGTAAGSSQISLQVIVFFAVILHKAPASFGLVSYLMYAGLEKKQIQKHLFIFSLAAPLLAITTYFIVSKSSVGSLHQTKATGIGLLFSAGTFLYVASVHVLPEVSSQTQHRVASNGGRKGLGILESLTLIVGCTIPVLLSLGLHDA